GHRAIGIDRLRAAPHVVEEPRAEIRRFGRLRFEAARAHGGEAGERFLLERLRLRRVLLLVSCAREDARLLDLESGALIGRRALERQLDGARGDLVAAESLRAV